MHSILRTLRKPLDFFRSLTVSFFLIPIVLGSFVNPALAKDETKKEPATEEELFLYRAIGATYICVARELDIEFSKASAIATITYVNILEGKHGGKMKGVRDKTFTRKELIFGANNQLIPAAVEYCPKQVPSKTKKQVKKLLKELKAKSKKK